MEQKALDVLGVGLAAGPQSGVNTLNVLCIGSSPRGSESYANRVAMPLVGELREIQPDGPVSVRLHTPARDIVEARRALIAELEQRRRAAALAA